MEIEKKAIISCAPSREIVENIDDKHKFIELVKNLIVLSPSLIQRLDENDNNPLLYVCLKMRGCRHCLVEFLIEMGCDLQAIEIHMPKILSAYYI